MGTPSLLVRRAVRAMMSARLAPVAGVVLLIFILATFIYHYHKQVTYLETADNVETLAEIWLAPPVPKSEIQHNLCKWPILSPFEKEIDGFVTYHRSIHCNSDMPQLASLLPDGKLVVAPEVEKRKRMATPPFKCVYQQLSGSLAPNITEYGMGEPIELVQNTPTFIPVDQFVVRCFNETVYAYINGRGRTNGSIIFEKSFVNIPGKFAEKSEGDQRWSRPQPKTSQFTKASPMAPSLAILVLDSTSLNQFRRHMKETPEFMEQNNFLTMNMYNKVADNSAVNLLPVLAGRPIQTNPLNEDPEDAFVVLEEQKFIWDMMKERGCVTMINDDIMDPTRGLFHYPNKTFQGFTRQPTDFFLRPYHNFNYKHRVTPTVGGQCMKDGEVTYKEYLSHYEQFSLHFKDKCHFSFNFLTALTHDDPSYIGAIDHDLRVTLERFFLNGVANNTVLVVMGDHGNRIHDIQRTFTGRVEERNPLFAIHFPDEWRKREVDKFHKFRVNVNRLVSNFDIHELLKDIALSDWKEDREPGLGFSPLREEFQMERSCEDAHIPPNFCLCMDNKELRSSMLTNETSEYKKVLEIVTAELMRQPCVLRSEDTVPDFETLQAFSLNQMVLHGLRDQRQWKDVKNFTVGADIEFLELAVRAITTPRFDGKNLGFVTVARVKHYLRNDTYELCGSPRIRERNIICFAPTLDDICEMCHADNLIATERDII